MTTEHRYNNTTYRGCGRGGRGSINGGRFPGRRASNDQQRLVHGQRIAKIMECEHCQGTQPGAGHLRRGVRRHSKGGDDARRSAPIWEPDRKHQIQQRVA